MQGIRMRSNDKYANDSLKGSVTLFSESFSKINEELYSRNYNQKHFIAETKRKHMRTFHVQLLF